MPNKLLEPITGSSFDESLLNQIEVSSSNVQSGYAFMDKYGQIRYGTLSLSGNASTSDVKSGMSFYSNSFTKRTGSLSLSGNATTSDVMSGKTFYSNSFTKQTGDMSFANKIRTVEVSRANEGNEYRNGTASVNVGAQITYVVTGQMGAVTNDDASISVTGFSGSTINYSWRTHNVGIKAKIVYVVA